MIIVAEIGINHNGSLNHAFKLIDAAVDAGADAVKFQKRTVEICVPKAEWDKQRDTPWGPMSYVDYKRRLEFGKEEYNEINAYCRSKGIDWSASVWDSPSLLFLERYDPPWHKVASAMNTNYELLGEIASTGRPVIMSTGMNDMQGIHRAVEIFGSSYNLSLLHCVGSYPAEDEVLNLANIRTLKRIYPQLAIGYSNHSPGAIACVAAAALGAEIIEAHITLDRAGWGSDQAASIEAGAWRWLVKSCRNMPVVLGNGEHKFLEIEKDVARKLRWHSSG